MTTESNVVRIVNLDDSFTEEKLKKFILINCQLRGTVKNVYVKRDNKINIFYGYVVFEYGYDALKTTEILNGHTFISNELEVELIGPYLKYRKYGIDGGSINFYEIL